MKHTETEIQINLKQLVKGFGKGFMAGLAISAILLGLFLLSFSFFQQQSLNLPALFSIIAGAVYIFMSFLNADKNDDNQLRLF